MQNRIEKAKKIKLLILDVDGVLTDAKLYFDEQGKEYKAFNVRDGLGIKLLQKAGIEVAVISGRASKPVELRMEMLGIKLVYLGQLDKGEAFKDIIAKVGCTADQAAHVGDDLIDLPVLIQVGLAIAVQDASEFILPYVDWQTHLTGGHGAVREVCDFILQAQGKMDGLVESFKKI
ncbi:3-deoxy-D-manno-octulosonate 8-phosphate phosphatase [Bathymodiolus platifrons methanotrophic gill symbiont]|uniref:3-deoxy-manno-octulosonate-8-phosphatase KdsC n=1 Tax=Bathymodiolus platifrons methanotrophic gill symbiont TaxID=113268 RepID=UPI000B4156AE|nr:3-deoxy-manno-octulosonate-8-phosphatase KdsC [Bathymodiolus platifrons methanotrophic gill symbiont]MCK5869689.1 3-deoxy-manno-octulosonate-8-phosphatase KdsC [Methyloprofundus sp.]TXK96136.1 3-deoxy-D-manno-octulosonate 8-phosphate phosphatase [Methylococcaceae bacterium CS4]TXK97781.1 3-deoxy-D-manno-octulosonate 8-phosphate phosphatase [Methylococcaceae bacterium CS5]TXL05779.1 3-deoxy-D-manno-octulosonate 8-phosphate phosphatase [Methylococcaceae bacterium CS1]TXL08129.1 3-deoxy-D-mann